MFIDSQSILKQAQHRAGNDRHGSVIPVKLSLAPRKRESKFWLLFILFLFCILPVSHVFSEVKVSGEEIKKTDGNNNKLEQVSAPVKKRRYDKSMVFQVQKKLKDLGYDLGAIDGIWGRKTENIVKKFQNDNSLPVTGAIDYATIIKLNLVSGGLKKEAVVLFLSGALMAIAFFQFSFFHFRGKGVSSLCLGSLCLLGAYMYMVSSNIFFHTLFPRFGWVLHIKIQLFCVGLSLMIFVFFIKSLYPKDFSQAIFRVALSLSVLLILLPLVSNNDMYTYEIVSYGVIALLVIIFLICVFTRAILKRRTGAILSLSGFFLLLATVINGISYDQIIIFKGQFLPFGIFVFIFLQSFVLSQRFAKDSKMEISYERFVPKKFLTNLNKDDILDIKLGDNAQLDMSVLFTDIRDFTTLSEKMTPEENFKFLNSYLSQIGPVINKNNGFIDKYIGDAIMALFDKSPDDAVRGGIEMLHKLTQYNEGRKRAGYVPIRIGIGINTGSMMIGTIGEHDRMEGTVISDAVNVASRVEGMTKIYGVSLLITDQTYRGLKAPNKYHIRKIDQVKVKGRTEPVTMWEVFDGDPLDSLNYKLSIASIFEDALSLYQSKRFEKAKELFLDCLAKNSKDKTAELYIDRCKLYIKMGVDNSLEGVVRRVIYEKVI